MIQKLRRKFILINMLLVSIVLVCVFAVLLGTNYQRTVEQSKGSMLMALKWNDDQPPPRFEIGAVPPAGFRQGDDERRFSMVPVFVVTLDEAGGVAQTWTAGGVEVTGEVAAQAAAAAGHSGADEGVISELGLRYLRGSGHDGTDRVAFADISWERASLWPLIRTSLVVGALALGGFFLISLLLSSLALRPAAAAWEQQRRFVADASHELKTPLTVILTNTGILLSHTGDPIARQQKWVEYIRDEAQRMRGLVEDLLFLAKNDGERAGELRPEPVDLTELVWSALLPFEPVAFEQGVELVSDVGEGIGITGRADQLRRLVTILLDNAVKYAGPGGRVTLKLAPGEKGGVRLTVNNTGAPIPLEHLPHLFERFYRADDSRARASGGYGLGLSIARSIVDKHRGTIAVTSTAEAGTTFTVRLPG